MEKSTNSTSATTSSSTGDLFESKGSNGSATTIPSQLIANMRPFDYPINDLPIDNAIPSNIDSSEFSEVKYLSNGSNSYVYTAIWKNQNVVVKMLKSKLSNHRIAKQEILFETAMLARINHPNIVKIMGAGEDPRKFVVLEHLEGGTLDKLLSSQSTLAMKTGIHKKESLHIKSSISIAREIASALNYLHNDFSTSATLIHRDLKPQNIGFSADGQLKLFDFGLMSCVKKRVSSNESYNMTGNTGTLAYMAPEVALRKAYSEKVDIYSFGMILWQLLSSDIPFRGMTKDEHLNNVVKGGQRPRISDDLPLMLIRLIERCWHADPVKRPCAREILDVLDCVSDEINSCGGSLRSKKSLSPSNSWNFFHQSKSHKIADLSTLTASSPIANNSANSHNNNNNQEAIIKAVQRSKTGWF